MLTLSSELREFSAESAFIWNIKNFRQITWEKGFVIISKEITFKEANARWYLKLSPFIYNDRSIFLVSKVFMHMDTLDENASYKFYITLKDGQVLESVLFRINREFKPFIEYEMTKYIKIEKDDSVELEVKVIYHTMRHVPEEPVTEEPVAEEPATEEPVAEEMLPILSSKEEDGYDHLLDVEEEAIPDEKSCSAKFEDKVGDVCGISIDESDSSDSSSTCISPISNKRELMNDTDLTLAISNIYINNMKQIADTSASLLISAVRNNHKDLLADCLSSFAAQMNSKNFTNIWEIAVKLNIEDLKKAVIQYVIANRERITYDEKMSSELMLKVVHAME